MAVIDANKPSSFGFQATMAHMQDIRAHANLMASALAVGRVYGLAPLDVLSRVNCRGPKFEPFQVAVYISVTVLVTNKSSLARVVGRSCSTVRRICNEIVDRRDDDPEFDARIDMMGDMVCPLDMAVNYG